MDKNKIIIIVLIAVIAVLAVGVFSLSNHQKVDTEVKISVDKPVYEGDSIKIKLTDANGTGINDETVNITVTDKDDTNSYYSVKTNKKGVAKFKMDKKPGKYSVNCSYGGNDNYSASSAVKKIKIKKEVVQAETSQDSSDDYVYSAQDGRNVKASGEWSTDSTGNRIYKYQGEDGVLYEKYYDSNGNEINPNDYY